MLDIDYFKPINDTYGHKLGDTVLCKFTKILENFIRTTDSAKYAAKKAGRNQVQTA